MQPPLVTDGGDGVLDADSILAIHRYEDGGIGILRNRPGHDLEQLWMVTPADLRGTFRAFQEWLTVGGHFTTQGYRTPAPWRHDETGLWAIGVDKSRAKGERRWGRVQENVKWLNCLSLDVDYHDAPPDPVLAPWRHAQRRMEGLQDAGIIPPMSIYGYSGRGLYVFWLLHDERNPDQSAPALNHHVQTWKALQRELIRRAREAAIPADAHGSLITQYLKIGGTINPKSGTHVQYFITLQADSSRRMISYSIRDMARLLNIGHLDGDLPAKTRAIANPQCWRRKAIVKRNPNMAAGYKRRHALIADDIQTIHAHRLQDGSGGWVKRNHPYADSHRSPKYGRRNIIFLFAKCLVRSRYSPRELRPPAKMDPNTRTEILSRLKDMGEKCNPPWPDDDRDGGAAAFDRILDEVLLDYVPQWNGKQYVPATQSTTTLLAAFGVTAELAAELDLKSIRPREVAIASHRALPTQEELITKRRALALAFAKWKPISSTELAMVYKKHGIRGANHTTASQDLNAIGCARMGKGRRRKALPTPGWKGDLFQEEDLKSTEKFARAVATTPA